MIKIYNVGQGDSFLFKPDSCMYNKTPILIDCGTKSAKVYKKIVENIDTVLISHSHGDHLNGLEDIIKYKNISNLYIPYYFSEIYSILNYLKLNKHKKNNKLFIKSLSKVSIHLLKEDDELCNHIKIYNPPINHFEYFGDWIIRNDNHNIDMALKHLKTLGFDLPDNEILNYKSPLNESIKDNNIKNEYNQNARKFIHNFFQTLSIRLIDEITISIPKQTKIYFQSIANKASIVLKFKNEYKSYLFTGDADISVFERIFEKHGQDSLSTDILKVPHHGSKKNLNERILKKIKPSVAIFSHKNEYEHPDEDIIMLMKQLNIKDYYTNDVKRKTVVRIKTVGQCESGELEFI